LSSTCPTESTAQVRTPSAVLSLSCVAIDPRADPCASFSFSPPDLSFEDEVSAELPWSGPQRLQVSAEALTIGDRVDFLLSLPCPANDVTIYGARAYVCQTVRSRSASGGEAQTMAGPKRSLFSSGYLEGWQAADFAARAAEKHASELLLVPGRPAGEKEDGWTLSCSGILVRTRPRRPLLPPQQLTDRLPSLTLQDAALRPTTLTAAKGSTAGLAFSSELVVEVFFSQRGTGAGPDDGRLMIATLYRKSVTLLRCVAPSPRSCLPAYLPAAFALWSPRLTSPRFFPLPSAAQSALATPSPCPSTPPRRVSSVTTSALHPAGNRLPSRSYESARSLTSLGPTSARRRLHSFTSR
jgi:hypothetical protein